MLNVVAYPSEVLHARCEPVAAFGFDLRCLADGMAEAMYASSGVGLAAPQVGVLQRLIVMDATGLGAAGDLVVMVNPVILSASAETFVSREGCLSLPGIELAVKRHCSVSVGYIDLDEKVQQLELTGFASRIVQHEIDHLDGILMIDRASTVSRKLVLKGLSQVG